MDFNKVLYKKAELEQKIEMYEKRITRAKKLLESSKKQLEKVNKEIVASAEFLAEALGEDPETIREKLEQKVNDNVPEKDKEEPAASDQPKPKEKKEKAADIADIPVIKDTSKYMPDYEQEEGSQDEERSDQIIEEPKPSRRKMNP